MGNLGYIRILGYIGYVLCGLFAGIFALVGLVLFGYWLYFFFKGNRRFGSPLPVYKRNVARQIFYELPLALIYQWYTTPRDFFKPSGLVIFEGRQGSGKTVAMTEQVLRWHKMYPAAYVMDNYGLACSNELISNYYPVVHYTNGFRGVIVALDELQNWFASSHNSSFPADMLGVITQNRKNRRVILGTSQVFVRLAKPIREQTVEVRKCFTIAGCITFVRRMAPELDEKGDVKEWKSLGFYWFPHTLELRQSYDTWKVIEHMEI